MKSLLHKKAASPVVKLSAVALTCLALFPKAEAGVIWLASDTSDGLVLATTGSLNVGNIGGVWESNFSGGPAGRLVSQIREVDFGAFNRTAPFSRVKTGSFSSFGLFPSYNLDYTSDVVGHTFRVTGIPENSMGGGEVGRGDLYWDPASESVPGTITPITRMTFSDSTVDSVFGPSLDGGPVTFWTEFTTGDTISVGLASDHDMSSIPEPTGVLSLGALLGLGLFFRSRR